jgi:AmmeMemoRadiSam system protein B
MRLACAAGGFYPAAVDDLKKSIETCFSHKLGPKGGASPILGAVVPHAGYIYSGPAMAWVYHHLRATAQKTVVYLGPNHTGYGTPISLSSDASWQTPFGEVSVDVKMRDAIKAACKQASVEELSHKFEHSIEVQLPFLQTVWKAPKVVPVALATMDAKSLQELGKALSSQDCIVLASSDLSHYLSQAQANEKDHMALERILKLDPAGLLKIVIEKDISMCGAPAAAAMLWALKGKAKKAELLQYYTSGDITGDMSAVVGYGAIAVR